MTDRASKLNESPTQTTARIVFGKVSMTCSASLLFAEPTGTPTLKDASQWMLWRRVGKKKLPFSTDGKPSACNRRDDFRTYEQACTAAGNVPCAGLAFCFETDDPFTGIDLDDCIAEDGTVSDWARPILEDFGGNYIEISPSGHGVKIFTLGVKPEGMLSNVRQKDGGGVECYDHGRFFAVTEDVTGAAKQYGGPNPIPSQAAIDKLFREHLSPSNGKPKAKEPSAKTPSPPKVSTHEMDRLRERATFYISGADVPADGSRNSSTFRLAGHVLALTEDGATLGC